MIRFLRPIVSPLLSLTLLMLAVGLFSTFVSLKLTLTHTNTFILGAVSASYFAGLTLGSVYIEKVISQIGHIRAFSALAALTGSLVLAMSFSMNPFSWMLCRFFIVLPFCTGSSRPADLQARAGEGTARWFSE